MADTHAFQSHKGVLQPFEHAVDLPFSAFVNGDAIVEWRQRDLFDPRRVGQAIFQSDAALQLDFFLSDEPALYLYQVLFFMLELRVGQPVGEVAVVGEQEQSGSIDIQPAHRVKPVFFISRGDYIQDGLSAFFVAGGGDDAGRFIEHQTDHIVGL
jgi:hypothetical protein